jgi:phenylalanyl-tRNA synthetase beta subunit
VQAQVITIAHQSQQRKGQEVHDQIDQELGVRIGFNNVILLANKMGYEAALVGSSVRFAVPAYRLDIINEQDIVEDVAVPTATTT